MSKEIKVGIIAILAILICFFGINFLKGSAIFGGDKTLYAKYPKIEGLTKASPVMMYGFQVGRIDDIRMINEPINKIEVKFHVRKDIDIPKSSLAEIFAKDILGAMAIELMPFGNLKSFESGDSLKGTLRLGIFDKVGSAIDPLTEKVGHLMSSVDTTINAINGIFNESTRKNLRHSFTSINGALDHINHATLVVDDLTSKQSEVINKIMNNVASITTTLKNHEGSITKMIDNFSNISDSLKAANIKSTLLMAQKSVSDLSNMISKIEKGEGTIGQLVTNKKMYNNLEESSKNLNLLVEDLRLRPFRYVHFSLFGRKYQEKKKDTVISSQK